MQAVEEHSSAEEPQHEQLSQEAQELKELLQVFGFSVSGRNRDESCGSADGRASAVSAPVEITVAAPKATDRAIPG